MNFFDKLFIFLFHKNHIITKRLHTLGAILVTTCFVSIVILGVNGYASTIYASTNQDEQAIVSAENESRELDSLLLEEEDIEFSCNAITDDILKMYTEYHEFRMAEQQVEAKTLGKMTEENITLSTSAGIVPNRDPIELTKEDYDVLLRIVEAEVGAEDLKTRMIIANVIINRMQHSYYPNTIKEVVFQNNGKVYQFSPILDGRYNKVTVSKKTVEAVNNAIAGYDNSDGALAFVNRTNTSAKIMEWFDNNLTFVKKYGSVEYFKF